MSEETLSRADRFRRRYRSGECLRGRVVSYIDSGRAWVRVGDLTLVAAIRPGLASGRFLTFTVHSLYPEILLVECGEDAVSFAEARNAFILERTLFEDAMEKTAGPRWPEQFRRCMVEAHSLWREYLALADRVHSISSGLSNGQQIFYCPWLLSSLRESVIIRSPGTMGSSVEEILGHGLLPTREDVWVQILFTPKQSRVRCFVPDARQREAGHRLPGLDVDSGARFPLRTPWDRLRGSSSRSGFSTII